MGGTKYELAYGETPNMCGKSTNQELADKHNVTCNMRWYPKALPVTLDCGFVSCICG